MSQVGKAGEALRGILELVSEISGHIGAISDAASRQSGGVSEISGAVGQLDTATQENAAMFQETAAASRVLANEAQALFELAGRFRTDVDAETGADTGETSPEADRTAA